MNKISFVLIKSLIVNGILVLTKIVTGIIGNSRVIIADGIHSLSDLSTDIVSIIGSKLSNKPADEKHSYGHGKVEYLTSIIIGLVILVLGISLIGNAFTNTNNNPTTLVFYVTVFTTIIKYLLASYLLSKGKKYKSQILISSGKESQADIYSSLVVLISYIGSRLTTYNGIFKYSDAVGTAIVGLLILKTSYTILKENFISILGEEEKDEEILKKIKKILTDQTEHFKIGTLSVLKYGTYYKVELSIIVNPNLKVKDANKIENAIKKSLLNSEINIAYVRISSIPKENAWRTRSRNR